MAGPLWLHCSAAVRVTSEQQQQRQTPAAPSSPWPLGGRAGEAAARSSGGSSSSSPLTSSAAAEVRRGGHNITRPAQAGVCRVCRGRRFVSTPSGPAPCTACAAWRNRPDYQPSRPLLSVKDLNLAALDPPDRLSATAASSATSSGGGDGESGKEMRRDRRGGQMSEERRQAIKEAMQRRGPLQEDHRRSIARAMRAAHAADPSMRMAGRPKHCGYCGDTGHNKAGCPLLHPDRAQAALNKQAKQPQPESQPRRKDVSYTCSACGQTGHNRRSCPQLLEEQARGRATAAEQAPVKMIVVQEVDQAVANGVPEAEGEAPAPPPRLPAGDTPDVYDWGGASSAMQPVRARASSRGSPGGNDIAGGSSIGDRRDVLPAVPPVSISVAAPLLLEPGVSLSEDGGIVFPLPTRREQCVSQAAAAVLRAWEDGIRRQALELLLPQPSGVVGGDWPGGIRQQFRAALPMVEDLLLQVKQAEVLQGRITAEWLDEGDCVGAWQSERLAAVLFPSAEVLPAVQRIDGALSGKRLTLLLNPQWQTAGQVVSDFGFGRSRRAAERYIDSLENVYCLRQVRVLGDELRVLRCYPGQWQVHFVRSTTQSTLMAVEDSKPTYQRLLELLKNVPGSRASKSWLDRVLTPSSYDELSGYDDGLQGAVDAVDAAAAADVEDGPEVERDIVTGEVVRDYKMAPIQAMAKWLGGEGTRPRGR